MSLYLAVYDGHDPRQVFRLDEPATLRIGRGPDADMPLQDRRVSRRHCLAGVRDDRVWLLDTQSRNGTWVDGRRLGDEAWWLRPGALVGLGGARLTLLDSPGEFEGAGWEGCGEPRRLMGYLPARGSGRKLRLLASAFSRLLLPRMPGPHARALVETAERFADGLVTAGELQEARQKAEGELAALPPGGDDWLATQAAIHLAEPYARDAARRALEILDRFLPGSPAPCRLVRDVLGDFFLPGSAGGLRAVRDDRTVASMAGVIYAERAFADLPVLADALEEAGCDDAAVLSHCRSDGGHVRGCWVLDALLASRCRPTDAGDTGTAAP